MSKASKHDIPLLRTGIANKWKGRQTTFSFGRESLRFWWLNEGKRVSLNGWVESFSWDDQTDSAPVITGSASLRQSLVHSPIPPMRGGDTILCEIRMTPGGPWHEAARLRIQEPQRQASGTFTFQVSNDASLLLLSKDNWQFSHGKGHPKGWAAWQIIAEVCSRCGIRLVMPRTGKPIKKFPPMRHATAIDVINAALKKLREQEGRILVQRFEHGTLYLSQRHYSPALIALGPQIIDASLTETRKQDFATAITLRTTAEVAAGKDAKGKKKATHTGIVVEMPTTAAQRKKGLGAPSDKALDAQIKRYGYVHAVVYAHGASSKAEVRALGLWHLARVLQPDKQLSLQSPYIPGIRRGGYLRLAIPTLGLHQIVYVKGVTVSADAGALMMDVPVGFVDPKL
jgi:hypothetical protein